MPTILALDVSSSFIGWAYDDEKDACDEAKRLVSRVEVCEVVG